MFGKTSDLNRLLSIYQYWTHQLYPKTQFKDTVDRVERLSHSRRMHVSLPVRYAFVSHQPMKNALSMWRDEFYGTKPTVDVEEDLEVSNDSNETQNDPEHAGQASSSPSRPPSSVVTDHEVDIDIDDAFIREVEDSVSAELGNIQKEKMIVAEDAEMLFLDEAPDSHRESKKAAMVPNISDDFPDDDDAMWDILDEMDGTNINSVNKAKPQAPYVSTVEEGWGDMYE